MAWLGELGLEEMLRDPIVKLVMRSDGVSETAIRTLMRRVRRQARELQPRGG